MRRAIAIRSNMNSDERKDAELSTFVCAYFFLQALNLLVKIGKVPIPGWGFIPKIILGLLVLMALPAIITRARLTALIVELIVGCVFAFSLILGSHAEVDFPSLVVDEMIVFVPIGICAYSVLDYSDLLNRLQKWSYPSHIVLFTLCFFLFRSQASSNSYSMSVGYAFLLQMLIMIDSFIEKRRIIDLVFAIIDFVLIIMLGSRGPLLCIMVYFVFRILEGISTKRLKGVVFFLGIIAAAIIYLLYPILIKLLINISNAVLGSNSRTIRLLLNEQLTYEAGRESIYSYTIERIKDRPIFGWGVGGGWMNGSYPHNLFLEMALSFGIPAAVVISIWLLAIVFKGFRTKDADRKRVFIVFLSCSVSLLFSGSFLLSSTFFITILLGLKNDGMMGSVASDGRLADYS